MGLSRRSALKLAGLAGVAKIVGTSVTHADEKVFRQSSTLFGQAKYPDSFAHFDYVNPQAPKGGHARLYAVGTFDSLNAYSFKGTPATLAALGDETLFARPLDESSAMYANVASGLWYPPDLSRVIYRMDPRAHFHDGSAMTPADAIWSMEALKAASPKRNAYYRNVASAEQSGDHEVTFIFSEAGNRELPHIVGQLPVLSKTWWTGQRADGTVRDIAKSTSEIPLGSGPYRVTEVRPGTSIKAMRVAEFWGRDLPVNMGQNNFDTLEVIYFLDNNVALEAFKADQYDFRVEPSAKAWATGYDFPAVIQGKVLREEIKLKSVKGMQGFVFNTRRPKFQSPLLRQAFNLVFDFEWMNTNLFYGQYERSRSYFGGSDMEETGLPDAAELAILEPLRGEVPDEVFTTPYANPVNSDPQERRKNMRQAMGLLKQAGFSLAQDGGGSVLRDAKGVPLQVEFLLDSPLTERIVLPWSQQLKQLGVTSTIRTVDASQYQQLTQTFDFDIIVNAFPQSDSPGNEQRDYWGSQAAETPGSANTIGIHDVAIDQIIDKIIMAPDRPSLVAACRALDRALIWHHYVVPMYFTPNTRVARWNRFGKPDIMPTRALGFPTIWWWDEAKAKETAS